MKMQFNGWAAIPVGILVLLFLGYRAFSARSALEGEQGDRLRLQLQGEYASVLLPEVRKARAADQEKEMVARVKELVALEDIRFTSVGVKGTGEKVVVKLDIEVSGKAPPDGRPTRFYRMRHRKIGGWRVEREVSSLSYYLKLF